MTVTRTPTPFRRRREYLRSPIGRSPVRDALGGLRASFLLSSAAGGSAIPDSGLAHHYDATQITGSDGDAIGTWTDQEGTKDFEQSTSSQKPTLKTDIQNGNNILRFASDDGMVASSVSIAQGVTIFIVLQKDASGSPQAILQSSAGIGNEPRFGWNGSQYVIDAGTIVGGGSESTAFEIYEIVFDGANSELDISGTDTLSGDAGDVDFSGDMYIAQNTGSEAHLDGDIGEAVIYDVALSSSQRTDVRDYLSSKWDIAV